jgi:hypothetical protein
MLTDNQKVLMNYIALLAPHDARVGGRWGRTLNILELRGLVRVKRGDRRRPHLVGLTVAGEKALLMSSVVGRTQYQWPPATSEDQA